MRFQLITVARSLGAGGEEVGRLVAEALGFRYVDYEIIVKAAERAGVSPEAVERAEHGRPLVLRILEALTTSPPPALELDSWATGSFLPASPSPTYEDLVLQVIGETAESGDVVIVAHGAGIRLAGRRGLLRLFVTASPEVRAARLASRAMLNRREAARDVRASDRERADFLRRFYGLPRELPTHYDLVVNTDLLTPDEAAQLVVTMAKG